MWSRKLPLAPPMISVWWVWDMSLRKRLSPSPMVRQYSEKRLHARILFSSVFSPTAVWRAAVAEARSAMRRSCLAVEQFQSAVEVERSRLAEDLGEFIVCSIVVPGEGVGNVVIGSTDHWLYSLISFER